MDIAGLDTFHIFVAANFNVKFAELLHQESPLFAAWATSSWKAPSREEFAELGCLLCLTVKVRLKCFRPSIVSKRHAECSIDAEEQHIVMTCHDKVNQVRVT